MDFILLGVSLPPLGAAGTLPPLFRSPHENTADIAGRTDCISPVQLTWRFKSGEKFDVSIAQDMQMEMKVFGNDVKTAANSVMTMEWVVNDVDTKAGTYDVTQTFKRMKMTMDAPAPVGKISFDSDAKEEPKGIAAQVAGSVKPLIGATFKLKMDGTGKVIEATIDEETKKAFTKTAQLNQLLSEDALKSLLAQAGAMLPEMPVKSGDTWKFVAELKNAGGTMKMDGTNTLDGIVKRDGKKLAKIDQVIKIEMKPQGAIKVSLKDQDTKGSLLFDIDAGRLAESSMVQKMTMAIDAAGMTVEQKLNITTQLKLTPAK